MDTVVCTVKKAMELMSHLDEEDEVTLTILNKKTYLHEEPKRIKKKKGKELIVKAETIKYQDNDFFGVLFLLGVFKNKDIVQSVSFPQLE